MVLWSVAQVLMLSGGGGGVIISSTEQNMKLKFSLLTYLTHINTTLECYHASVIYDVDVLYLEDGTVHRLLLKNKTAATFSSYGTF